MRGVEGFHFEGGKELEAALEELAAEAGNSRSGKAAMRRAAAKALEVFADAWRELVPRLTGQYEESITVGTNLTKRQRRLVKREGKSYVEVYAGTSDPAGVMQEFGTAHHPAQPSARRAWDQTKNQVLDNLGPLVWEHLQKTAERLIRKRARRR